MDGSFDQLIDGSIGDGWIGLMVDRLAGGWIFKSMNAWINGSMCRCVDG